MVVGVHADRPDDLDVAIRDLDNIEAGDADLPLKLVRLTQDERKECLTN